MISNGADELLPQRYIQSESALRQVPAAHYTASNELMATILEYLNRD
jgi:hypothetical protein